MRILISTDTVTERILEILSMKYLNNHVKDREIRVLNIGLGGGKTASEIIASPRTKLTVSEINPVVYEANKKCWQDYNNNLLSKKNKNRLTVKIENEFDTLRKSKDNYWDGIIIDIEEPTIIYSSGLYTKEAFELIKRKLKPNGLFGLWAQDSFDNYAKLMLNTLESVFSNVELRVLFEVSNMYYLLADPNELNENESLNFEQPELCEKELAGVYTFFASENDMSEPVLEKYFNINRLYSLPTNYTEKYYSK